MTRALGDGVVRRSAVAARGHGPATQRARRSRPDRADVTTTPRPDLKPPPVKILKRTRHTTPGYIFIAPKKKVVQAGPLILDNRGRVVWFLPLDTHGVTDFRVQRYRGRPVLTWWHGARTRAAATSGYSIYDDSYRLVTHVPARATGSPATSTSSRSPRGTRR